MKIGNIDLSNVKIGNTQTQKVMLGNTLVWEYFNKFNGSVGVYGLSKKIPSYVGSLIRIRRASDNVETDIGFDINGNLDISTINTFIGNYRNYVKNTNLIQYLSGQNFWNYQLGTIIYTTNQEDAFSGTNGTKITSTTSTTPMLGCNSSVPPIINGTKITISVHCKAVEANVVRVGSILGNGRVEYNLSTQTATSIGSAVVSHSLTDVGDGWYRVSSTYNYDNPIGNSFLYGGFGCNTIANGVDGMLFSHPQIEFGDLTPFQENLLVQNTGSNNIYFYTVTTIYNQLGIGNDFINTTLNRQPTIVYNNEGVPYLTIFARDLKIDTATYLSATFGYTLYSNYRIDTTTTGTAKGIITLFGGVLGNANNISRVRVVSTNRMEQGVRFGGVVTANIQSGTGTVAINTYSKVGVSFKTNNFRSYFNGNKIGEDLVGTVTDGNILVWGGFNGGTESMNGFSNEFIIYGENKDDDFLQKLTEI